MEELPFRVEYAKSGRAKCRKCKVTIEKEELRLAAMVQVRILKKKNYRNIFTN